MPRVSEIPREPRALPEAPLPFCLQQLLLYHSIMTYMHIKILWLFPLNPQEAWLQLCPPYLPVTQLPLHTPIWTF